MLTTLILIGLTLVHIQPNRIAYGYFAGECVGNCGTIYEVTIKVLRVDTTSYRQTQDDLDNLKIKGQRLLEVEGNENFNAMKLSIPLIMLLDPRTIFGSPDGHDQGGYYLDFTLFGITRQYQIDKESKPFYFAGLTNEIDNKIKEVNIKLTKYGR